MIMMPLMMVSIFLTIGTTSNVKDEDDDGSYEHDGDDADDANQNRDKTRRILLI